MSTIGSDYSAHRRSIDDLEQDYETQAKKAKEREKTREAKLERNLEHVIRRKDEERENAIHDVKDRYESSIADRSKSDKLERDRMKKDVYDRTGRQIAAVVDAATTDRDRAIDAANEAEKHYQKAIADSESYYENRAKQDADDRQREVEAVAESYRKQIAEARGDGEDGDKSSTNQYREKLRKESESAIRQAREDVMSERRQAAKLAEQDQIALRDHEQKADKLLTTRLHENHLETQKTLHQTAEANRQSREAELQPLREQLMETADIKRRGEAEANLARSNAIKELESDWNAKYANQSLAHELEREKLRSDTADAERVYNERLGAYTRQKNQQTARLIASQNADHRDQMSAATREYDRSLNQVKDQAEYDKQRNERLLEREHYRAEDAKNRALDRQASTYQTTLERQRVAQSEQIRNLERVLNNKNTTADAGEISAAAEQTVRNAVTAQYEKKFQAEADRDRRGRDHMQASYEAKLQDARMDNQSNAAALNRQNFTEQSILKNTFVQHIADVEENKRQMLNLANESNARMTDEMTRNHERVTNEMRRHYEDLGADRDLMNSTRIREKTEEADFQRRALNREHQTQMAETVRTYEKKLSDQKSSYEEALRDMKAKMDQQQRDDDRRLKQALADANRAADHRLAETEAQAKDRERLLAQAHEEELDKVKKTNALLLSKKG